MKRKVFVLYDSVSELYGTPMFEANEASMMRALSDEVRRPESNIGKHAADYSLYGVGQYDDVAAIFVTHSPVLVVQVIALMDVAPA